MQKSSVHRLRHRRDRRRERGGGVRMDTPEKSAPPAAKQPGDLDPEEAQALLGLREK